MRKHPWGPVLDTIQIAVRTLNPWVRGSPIPEVASCVLAQLEYPNIQLTPLHIWAVGVLAIVDEERCARIASGMRARVVDAQLIHLLNIFYPPENAIVIRLDISQISEDAGRVEQKDVEEEISIVQLPGSEEFDMLYRHPIPAPMAESFVNPSFQYDEEFDFEILFPEGDGFFDIEAEDNTGGEELSAPLQLPHHDDYNWFNPIIGLGPRFRYVTQHNNDLNLEQLKKEINRRCTYFRYLWSQRL